jgi:CheY-like chemotaxis protein
MSTVLIVEDHADIRSLIRMTLELTACTVHEAADVTGGLAQVRRLAPDLVLLDEMMPGEGNGLDLCQLIRRDPALRHIKVVLLSARGTAADREAGLRAGADAYLVKPFSPMELLALVERETEAL